MLETLSPNVVGQINLEFHSIETKNVDRDVVSSNSSNEQSAHEEIAKKTKFTAQEMMVNADILIRHKEDTLAMSLLRQILNQDSFSSLAQVKLIGCLMKKQQYVEALKLCEALVSIDYRFETVALHAELLYKLNRDQESLEKYYEAIPLALQHGDTLFEVYKNIGNILVKRRDFDGAEENYNKAYTLNQRSDALFINFGTLEIQRDHFDKAKEHFTAALELNPNNDKAWTGLALAHNQFSDFELAWANIENALEIAPQNRTAVQICANWAVRDQKVSKVIPYIQSYLSEVENDVEMSLVLIHLFCLEKQYALATFEIERAICWNPHRLELYQIFEELHERVHDQEKGHFSQAYAQENEAGL